MSEPSGGASVQAVVARVAVLEADGVPLPGSANLYTTNAVIQLDATEVTTKGVDLEVMNAGGELCLVYKGRDPLKRYDLALQLCSLNPELEAMLVGGDITRSGGVAIGAAVPPVGSFGAPFGVSLELWSKNIIDGDLDPNWPYIHWALPRTYWSGPDKVTWSNANMIRSFTGYTSENPNWFNGPGNDFVGQSGRSISWVYTKSTPIPVLGAQPLAAS